MSLLNVEVNCEDTGETVRLSLTEDQYNVAIQDSEYVNQLVREARYNAANQNENRTEESQQNESSNIFTHSWQNDEEQEGNNSEASSFIWTNSAVLLLLSLYEEHSEDFTVKRHKKVWEDISQKMFTTNPTLRVTALQCQTKLNGLKRTYKKIMDHNNKSGSDRASWPFYERMHEIFGTQRWAQPLAVASERGPFPSIPEAQERENNENVRPAKKRKLDVMEKYITFMKEQIEQRKEERLERFNKVMETKEKHHREKMTLLREFLNKL